MGKMDQLRAKIEAVDELANKTIADFQNGQIDAAFLRKILTEMIDLLKELPELYKKEIPYFDPEDELFEKLGDLIRTGDSKYISEAENLKRYLTKLGQRNIKIVEGSNDLSKIGSDFELAKFKRYTLNLINMVEQSEKLIEDLKKKRRKKPRRINRRTPSINTNTPEIDRENYRIYLHRTRFIGKNGSVNYEPQLNILINTLLEMNWNTRRAIPQLGSNSHDNAYSEKLSRNKGLFSTHINGPEVFYWYIRTVKGITMLLCCERFGSEHKDISGRTQRTYGAPPNPAGQSNTWVEYGIEN